MVPVERVASWAAGVASEAGVVADIRGVAEVPAVVRLVADTVDMVVVVPADSCMFSHPCFTHLCVRRLLMQLYGITRVQRLFGLPG